MKYKILKEVRYAKDPKNGNIVTVCNPGEIHELPERIAEIYGYTPGGPFTQEIKPNEVDEQTLDFNGPSKKDTGNMPPKKQPRKPPRKKK